MNKIQKNLTLTLLLLLGLIPGISAQDAEMADNFRGEGKIYVVLAVILVILAGIFLYLFRLDKKIKKLEQENEAEEE